MEKKDKVSMANKPCSSYTLSPDTSRHNDFDYDTYFLLRDINYSCQDICNQLIEHIFMSDDVNICN